MGTLNDEILRATGGPTVNDGLRAWFLARVTLPDSSFVDVQGETGIEVKEIAFTLNGSGSILIDMYRITSGATAMSAIEFEFD